MSENIEQVLLSPQEKRKARNQRYQANLKLKSQEEQDAIKLKRYNSRFPCQEDKENHNENVWQS